MGHDSSPFDRFLCAVHRRQIALRIVERAGLGLLVGSGLAAVLVAVMLWRDGEGAWMLAGLSLAAGALVGAIAGAMARPSRLASASEADLQLGTADLLATALTLREHAHSRSDPWSQTVLALAAERCRRHTPGEVMLRRLGVRAWGGIVLAVAFVGVLTALSSASREAVASRMAGDGEDARAWAQADDRSAHRPIVEMKDVNPPAPRQRRDELSPEDLQSPAASGTLAQASPESDAKPEEGNPQRSNADPDASAPSGGRSQAKSSPKPRAAAAKPADNLATNSARNLTQRTEGTPQAGVGRRASELGVEGRSAGGVVAPDEQTSSRVVAPWQSGDWRATVESAERQLRSGRVPDDARDLVRGYFDRDASVR